MPLPLHHFERLTPCSVGWCSSGSDAEAARLCSDAGAHGLLRDAVSRCLHPLWSWLWSRCSLRAVCLQLSDPDRPVRLAVLDHAERLLLRCDASNAGASGGSGESKSSGGAGSSGSLCREFAAFWSSLDPVSSSVRCLACCSSRRMHQSVRAVLTVCVVNSRLRSGGAASSRPALTRRPVPSSLWRTRPCQTAKTDHRVMACANGWSRKSQ